MNSVTKATLRGQKPVRLVGSGMRSAVGVLLLPLQVFVEHAFSSCVRCLATDADSDVVWAGDEAGRLAVFRWACRQPSLAPLPSCCSSVQLSIHASWPGQPSAGWGFGAHRL